VYEYLCLYCVTLKKIVISTIVQGHAIADVSRVFMP
jgi:hypothetical protein